MLICTGGEVGVRGQGKEKGLRRAESMVLSADDGVVTVNGSGEVASPLAPLAHSMRWRMADVL